MLIYIYIYICYIFIYRHELNVSHCICFYSIFKVKMCLVCGWNFPACAWLVEMCLQGNYFPLIYILYIYIHILNTESKIL